MFRDKYEKFKKSVEDFNLIPDETKRIVIGMSGGKDAAIMTHFLMEYKKNERPDIELEMVLAPVPHPFGKEIPEKVFDMPIDNRQKELIINQKKVMDDFHAYWSKYMNCISIPVQHELIDKRILKMNWSCIMCFNTKMKAFNEYFLKQPYEDNTLFACGWTKWDAHYTLISHLLKTDGSKWYECKKHNPEKYKADCIYLASFSAYPKVDLGIPGKKIYRINPMVEFDDTETYELSKEMEIPVLVDICKELYGDTFEQDRRYAAKYLEIFSKNQKYLNLSQNSILYNYRSLLEFMKNIQILPPVEEIEGLMYEGYNSNFDEVFNLLKK